PTGRGTRRRRRTLLGRLLLELDASTLELVVGRPDVVAREEEAAARALPHQRHDLVASLCVEDGRSRHRHQRDRDVGLPGHADGEPAEVAHLGDGDVVSELQPELLRVEGKRLVLVVNPDLDVRQLLQHVLLLSRQCRAATLAGALEVVFSKTAGLRPGPGLQDARRDPRAVRRRRMGGSVRRGGEAERASEARRERTDAPQPHREADVRHRPVGVAQQHGCPLEPAGQEVLVRRLAESLAELAAEVRRREVRGLSERGNVERIAIPGVGEVLRSEQVARGGNGLHGSGVLRSRTRRNSAYRPRSYTHLIAPPTTNGTPSPSWVSGAASRGPIGRVTYRAVLVIPAAAVRSPGSTTPTTYACRVGTSICESAKRESRSAIATPWLGARGIVARRTFDGRCVKTIVLSRPIRR